MISLKIYIISDSFIFPLVKGLSLKKIKPIFLRGTPAQFFFEKEGKWPILRVILENKLKSLKVAKLKDDDG